MRGKNLSPFDAGQTHDQWVNHVTRADGQILGDHILGQALSFLEIRSIQGYFDLSFKGPDQTN